jgi:hypothetical protein
VSDKNETESQDKFTDLVDKLSNIKAEMHVLEGRVSERPD